MPYQKVNSDNFVTDTTNVPDDTPSRWQTFVFWLINDARYLERTRFRSPRSLDLWRLIPFLAIHFGCFAVIWVGVSWFAVALALGLYVGRMFLITAFYHRFFAHRAFESSRPFRLLVAILGCTAGQRGPIWWASHHRQHHLHSDTELDPHSPQTDTFWFSHVLWFLTRDAFPIRWKQVKDLKRCRELVVLERLDWVPLMALGVFCFLIGEWVQASYPSLETNGWQTLVWGFFISTTALYHATYTINSLAHRYGHRRFDTPDHSRNNFLLALLTLGEGWHNNHHRYPGAARQGFYWWEVDLSYMGLRVLETLGLVWNLRPVPSKILEAGRARR
ncbi:MAG: acyl-CoA desaturase [Proteobacteria bacterium]|nr:acyl-CoA desaturase [Pseudomonadota bacterium]